MKKHNPNNERIKHKYRNFLKESQRLSEQSIDAVDHALASFDKYNGYKEFKRFHYQQAISFKRDLSKRLNARTGKPLSKTTLHRTLRNLKAFFQWLSMQPGFKSTVSYPDAEYFNLSEKDVRVTSARRQKRIPTLDQINVAISNMPSGSAIEKRDKALVAFTILTGARDSATASLRLKHVDLDTGCIHQDAREVRTKFSKTFDTYFFQVGGQSRAIFDEWVEYLRKELLWGDDDPLFPSTRMGLSKDGEFQAMGLKRENWKNADPIRRIFRKSFEDVGLPYYRPHSFRDTLVKLGERKCRTPEDFKAWSQNLGHEQVLTTFSSYGEVSGSRQADIIRNLDDQKRSTPDELKKMMSRLNSEFQALE
ncbi:MAG: recombinase XerC [OM182 bacterium BACL3 MAG-120920-bin41]|uniref:Recombinase XerC n=1 Tax=OM182 bacterium BACL3 MAG-120920-bin41 TaxID=1655580 RepID=A0A0R2TD83_9GAMM|nr:MAG: recombinase XerC [OM182 bacterium BACL3 MAG-120920-bin41]